MITGGDAVARVLAENGVEQTYVLIGNQTVSTAQGLYDRSIDVISARHEYNAAVMADTYGRLTGEPAVALTVAGPGGTNALTGVAQAYTAASPMLCLSAVLSEDAPTEALHGVDDPHFLEHAFEDATKWSTQVHTAEHLPETLNRAFDIITSGRPGPVFVGVDEDILMNEVDIPEDLFMWNHQGDTPPAPSAMVAAVEPIVDATRRVLYVGKGVSRAFAADDVVAIAEALNCPVVCPRHYPDSFPNDHELFVGTVGMSDHPAATYALNHADAVLSLGVRVSSHEVAVLNDRTPGGVDVVFFDSGERETTQMPATDVVSGNLDVIIGDVRAALENGTGETDDEYREGALAEADRVREGVRAYYEEVRDQTPVHPLVIMHELREAAADDVIITGDAGAAGGAWPNDAFEYRTTNTFQHSRVYDSMGFPVPAGNAAKLVAPDRQVVNLIGDGGFLMCNMELATAIATGTDAVTVVMNDAKYGMIRNYQRKGGFDEIATDIPRVDIAQLAESFGGRGIRVEDPDEVRPALEDALAADEHTVLDVIIDPDAEYVSRSVW
jgi:acetolactate synthase-1/2/3 large subunit